MPAALPAPTAPLPHAPAAVVTALRRDERALRAAIDRWDKTSPPPRDVTLLALFEQRLIRLLARDAPLARHVLALEPAARDDVVARRELGHLSATTPPPKMRIRVGTPPSARRLAGWYQAAGRRFGIRWELLAAVNFVESAFGRVRSASGAGALGPMQFEPATWRAYGLGGNVRDPHDAIFGAANYLAASGAARDERRALLRYNHSTLYADAVLRYARRIARDERRFYDYYSWQVYVRTRAGDRRLTGPR